MHLHLSLAPLLAVFSAQGLAALLPHISLLCVIAAAKLGVIMPLIVSTLAQPRFSARARTLLSFVSCLAAGACVCLATGVFSGLNWAAATLICLFVSWSLYEHFYKPVGLAPWVEEITSLGGAFLPLFGRAAVAALAAARDAAGDEIAQSKQEQETDGPSSDRQTGS